MNRRPPLAAPAFAWWFHPDPVVMLRRLGDRHVVQYKRAAVRMIEHAYHPRPS